MKIKISTLLIFTLLLFGCENSSTENTDKIITKQNEHHHDHENEVISLNNEKKWKVDDGMMIHIVSMENDVHTFEAKSVNDYPIMAKKLENNIDLLTSNCTMKGQAHDELHKWLLPFIDLSDEFSKSKSEQEFAVNFQKIKTSFITFNTYFE